MLKEATATGETIDQAIANAIAALGAPADADVHTEILEMPKKKVLGLFGGNPAKAKASYDAPEEKKPAAPAVKAQASKASKPEVKQPAKPEPKAKQPEKEAEAEAKAEPEEKQEVRTKIDASSKPSVEKAVNYLKEMVLGMGVEKADVEVFETEDKEIILELDCGDDYGIVIGRRGDTLDSIQYLTRLAAGRNKAEDDYTRISINVGNYREKRKHTLSELAKKNAAKVLKYGRNVTFEPMNPYERRIIHTTVQSIEGVTSHSVGSDDSRRVVISLAEGVKPTHPSNGYRGRGGYNKGGYNKGGYNKGGYKKGGYNKNRSGRSNYAPKDAAPTRAPKTDEGAKGVSLYGKIN